MPRLYPCDELYSNSPGKNATSEKGLMAEYWLLTYLYL